jgi:hypothetical protein
MLDDIKLAAFLVLGVACVYVCKIMINIMNMICRHAHHDEHVLRAFGLPVTLLAALLSPELRALQDAREAREEARARWILLENKAYDDKSTGGWG